VRLETEKTLTGNLHCAFGETGYWKNVDRKLALLFW
jgi:hypothetical protein